MKQKVRKLAFFSLFLLQLFSFNLIAQNSDSRKSLSQKYLQALDFMGAQDYDKAIAELKAIIDMEPSVGKVYSKIFEAFKWNNDLDNGLSYFQSLMLKNPNNPFGYYGMGLIFKEKKDWTNAIPKFKQTIRLSPEYPKPYKDFVDVMNESNQLEAAFQMINVIIHLNSNHATAYFALGYFYQLQRNWEKGLENLDKAIKLNPNLLDAYLIKGAILWYTSHFKEFLQISQSGLALAQKNNDLESQCNFLGNIGLAYLYLSNYDEAERHFSQSLQLALRIGYKTEEIRNLGNLGVVYRDKGQYLDALNYFKKAVTKAKAIGDRRREGLFNRNIGSVYSLMGDHSNAIEYLQKALPITVEIGDKNTEALVLWSLGISNSTLGNYNISIGYIQKAFRIAVEIGDRWGQARYLGTIGLNYWHLGNYSQAFENYEQALNLAKEIGDKSGQARQYGNIAIIYHELGNFTNGLEYYQQALKMTQEIGNKAEEARHLGNIGVLYHESQNYEMALNYYQHALKSYREIGDRANEAIFLGNLGYLYIDAKKYISSENYISQALKIARDIQDKRCEASQYINLGDLNFVQKNFKNALFNFRKAFQIGESIKNPKLVIEAQFGLGKNYHCLRQLKTSLTHYKLAINEIERLRSTLPTEKFKIGFMESQIRIYEDIINVLAELNKQFSLRNYDKQAFYYAERAKARSQLDIIHQGKVFHNLAEIPDEFRQKFLVNEAEFEDKHQKLSDELSKPEQNQGKERIRLLTTELETLQRNKTKLLNELKFMYPEYYRLTNPKIMSSEEVQSHILKNNQVLVEYLVGEENIFIWVLSKQQFKFDILDLKRKELESMLAHISPLFRKEKETTDLKIDHRWANIRTNLLLELYQILIEKPTLNFTEEGIELIIVPDDILFYFPFEILVTEIEKDKVHYLVERYPIAYSSSASLLNPEFRKAGTASGDLLAFGNPYFGEGQKKGFLDWVSSAIQYRSIFRDDKFLPLPNAELEVKAIAEKFNNPIVYIGREATEKRFKESASDFKFIHVATHHVLNDKQPMYSKILLAQGTEKIEDGYLQTYEVYNLKLNADVVVLSGCNTGLGKLRRGEGMIGITQAFLYAGVPSAVVSLWQVDDESTAYLMKNFYKYLKEGYNKTQALQKAKIELIQSSDWKRDPFYWGAFVLNGD